MKSINHTKFGLRTLLTGAVAALLASACCLGPLILISIGISGAWISKLAVLAPYQPLFIASALLALALAFRHIWRPAAQCTPDQVCALPKVKRTYQVLFVCASMLIVAVLVFPFLAPYFY